MIFDLSLKQPWFLFLAVAPLAQISDFAGGDSNCALELKPLTQYPGSALF